jgi:hypothetical protein
MIRVSWGYAFETRFDTNQCQWHGDQSGTIPRSTIKSMSRFRIGGPFLSLLVISNWIVNYTAEFSYPVLISYVVFPRSLVNTNPSDTFAVMP